MNKSEYKRIDMDNYPRKEHFEYFRTLSNPYVGVTVETDVTEILDFCKVNDISFYLTFMHAAALAADEISEFRQRINDGGIVEYNSCGTSHTESTGNGTYCYCTLYHHMPFAEYIKYAEKQREECKMNKGLEEDEDVESLYFISTLPWIHYTQLIQPTAGGDESNPRITWGKYDKNHNGRVMMPVSVLCNHALVDGIHLAKFYARLDEKMKQITEEEI